ncbi:MAG: hypothetical protein RR709_03645 [Ruthenibacterium sp.]
MRTAQKKLKNIAPTCILLALLLLSAVAIYLGCAALAPLRAALYILLYLGMPGFACYKLLLHGEILPETLCVPATILCGTGFFAAVTCVSARFGAWWLLQTAPPLFGICCLLILWRVGEKVILRKPTSDAQGHWLLYAVLLLVFLFCWVANTAHPAAVGNTLLKQDFLWNVGNARSFALGFPPLDLRFSGVRLQYHYLNELLVGGLAMVSGVSAYDWLAFCWPPFVMAAAIACLHTLGMILYRDSKKADFLPIAIFAAGGLGAFFALFSKTPFFNQMLYHLVTNINSVGIALMYTCIFISFVFTAMQTDFHVKPLFFILLLCETVLLCFAKGPVAIILVLAFVCAALWQSICQKGRWRTLSAALLLLVLVGVLFRATFSAGANNMLLRADATLLKGSFAPALLQIGKKSNLLYHAALPLFALLQTVCESPAVVLLYGACAVRDLRRFKSVPPQNVLLHAAALGGLLAFYIFDHYALSQIYFLFLSLQCMTFLGVDLLFSIKNKTAKIAAAVLCGISLLAGVVTVGGMAADGANRIVQYQIGEVPEFTMSAADEHAANWLYENMAPTELFATNRYYIDSPEEGNSNLYTAMSGRRAYMEGFLYAVSNMGVAESVVQEHRDTNAILFSPKSAPQTVVDTAHAAQVRYLVYDADYAFTGDTLAQFATLKQVFQEGKMKIYRIPD